MLHKKINCESLKQNICPALDAEEIKKQEQKDAIGKISYIHNFIAFQIP